MDVLIAIPLALIGAVLIYGPVLFYLWMQVVALLGAALIYGPVLLYLWMQVTTLLRWRGVWLVVAALPLLVMVPVGMMTVEAFRLESNLWPIMMILSAPGAALWLGAAMLLRRLKA
jgi:hypothetical protein